MAHEPTKLVLGRGEVYFDRFRPGTRIGEGERYLGNTSTFRIERAVKNTERATSYGGRKVMQTPLMVSETHSFNFTTDNIDIENLSLWFGAPAAIQNLTDTIVRESFLVKRGRFYQLGKTQNVSGTRNISEVAVWIGTTYINAASNYHLDVALGRIWIEPSSPAIADDAVLIVDFAIPDSDAAQVSSAPVQVQGSLRFIAKNEGPMNSHPQNDIFFPCVNLTARGQVDMKGDEWQQWSFEGDAFNLNAATQQMYVTRAAKSVEYSSAEAALIVEFGDLSEFQYWDDDLQTLVNIEWPPALDITGV